MCRSGASLYEFLPASDILMVAEAVLRVFQRYGDYEHKQRNRLKFLVKTMGWDAWLAAFQRELDEVRAAGGARLPFDPENPPVEAPPEGERPPAPAIAEIAALVTASAVKGPGIVPVMQPGDGGPGRERAEWLRTNLRPQKQPEVRAGHRHARPRRPERGADARAGCFVESVRRRHGSRDGRSEPGAALGAKRRRFRDCIAGSPRRVSTNPGRERSPMSPVVRGRNRAAWR